ncbi:hypothetical protein PIB30_008049 [Stylosanthes scabra]|uniref:Secreted protein n=1 Tax=Stylosanthes scabra TaxID=79078 RepID=A0ABU6W5X2_9FABA|nr:hypothetical protein [Stylosanthes scabra]
MLLRILRELLVSQSGLALPLRILAVSQHESEEFSRFHRESKLCGVQSEWHYFVVETADWSDECCLFGVTEIHGDLIVSGIGVHEREKFVPGSFVYQPINALEWVWIFRACLVQVGVVDAHLPLPITFGHHHHVAKPCGILDLLDESCFQETLNLFLDFGHFLRAHSPQLLHNRLAA